MRAQRWSEGTGLHMLQPRRSMRERVGQRHAPAALPPGRSPVTHSTEGWVCLRACLEGFGEEKISPPLEFELRTVQPLATPYTDHAISDKPPTPDLNVGTEYPL
jgi:hypothetical protein